MHLRARALLAAVTTLALSTPLSAGAGAAVLDPDPIPEITIDVGDVCGRPFDELRIDNSQLHVDKSVWVNGVWAQSPPGYDGPLYYDMSGTPSVTVEIFRQERDPWGFPTGPKELLSSQTHTYTSRSCPPRSPNRYVHLGGECDPSTGLTSVGWRLTNSADLVDGRPAGRTETINVVGTRVDAPSEEWHGVGVGVRDGETRDVLFEYQRPQGVPPGRYLYNFRVEGKPDGKRYVVFPSCSPQMPFPVDPDPSDNLPAKARVKFVRMSSYRMQIEVEAPTRMNTSTMTLYVTATRGKGAQVKKATLVLSRGERVRWRCGERKPARSPEAQQLRRICIKREGVTYRAFTIDGGRKTVLAESMTRRR